MTTPTDNERGGEVESLHQAVPKSWYDFCEKCSDIGHYSEDCTKIFSPMQPFDRAVGSKRQLYSAAIPSHPLLKAGTSGITDIQPKNSIMVLGSPNIPYDLSLAPKNKEEGMVSMDFSKNEGYIGHFWGSLPPPMAYWNGDLLCTFTIYKLTKNELVAPCDLVELKDQRKDEPLPSLKKSKDVKITDTMSIGQNRCDDRKISTEDYLNKDKAPMKDEKDNNNKKVINDWDLDFKSLEWSLEQYINFDDAESLENNSTAPAGDDINNNKTDTVDSKIVPKTPYQGSKRCIGEFKCSKCKRKWWSKKSYANYPEKCIKCNVDSYPYKQYNPKMVSRILVSNQILKEKMEHLNSGNMWEC